MEIHKYKSIGDIPIIFGICLGNNGKNLIIENINNFIDWYNEKNYNNLHK